MTWATWAAFCAAAIAMLVIPGPTILLVIGQSLGVATGRWRRVLPLVAGVAAGDALAMTVSLAGLGAVLAASAHAFTVLKWVGAAYLVWLGIKLWRAPVGDAAPVLPPGRAARQAFVVTALNPKGIAFFTAFVPQFLNAGQPFLPQAALLTVTFVSLGAVNAAAYAVLAGRLSGAVQRPAMRRGFNRLGGGVLITAGVATAAMRRA
ncbi:LysE family translocator [Humitalea sp. 24SJ18S-53]|uniref:LysE family translocator n=1 Tax=Humitalea sp. 24SJ18S-53 TaxID=3422307 RepID=UPI003D66B8F4